MCVNFERFICDNLPGLFDGETVIQAISKRLSPVLFLLGPGN